MSRSAIFSYHINPLWDIIRDIRGDVEKKLEGYDEDLRKAAAMAASELVENAVKRGTCQDGKGNGIEVCFTANESQIWIEVTNTARSGEDLSALKRHIRLISETDDPWELYVQRLTLLMEDTEEAKTRLGLYRIAYEGRFRLTCTIDKNTVTVTAVRNIKSR